jgi:hypothetical protein
MNSFIILIIGALGIAFSDIFMEDQMNFRPSWLRPSAAQTSFRRILSLEGTSIASLL